MDNTAQIKRKAQELARKGNLDAAAQQYSRLAEKQALEPYDLVVFGDLLARKGDRGNAVARYMEAMAGYSTAGLNRNAIALAKKVQRLSPNLIVVHRRLGDFYASEGLASESCLHYLEYLQRVDRASPDCADDVEDVCLRLLDLSLPSFDVVDTIVEIATVAGRQAKLVPGILNQAQKASAMGNGEAQARLHARATQLDPNAAVPEGGPEPPSGGGTFFDPGAVDLSAERDDPAETVSLESPDPNAAAASAGMLEDESAGLSLDVEYDEVEAPPPPAPVPAAPAAPAAEEGDDEEVEEDGDVLRARGLEFQMADEPAQAQRCFLKAAASFFQQGRAQEAWELYERVVRHDPNQLDALRGLVELAHINGEKAKMAHWGCELGDVLLARERYADAKVQFERVLAFDPENPKARSRLRRLNAIAGMSEASFGELAPAAGEVQGAQVTVRDEETEGSQSAFDLSQILDEFRSAVVDRIPPEDGQSHYDLGMTYREMGLLQEAAVEFEAAADHEENRSSSLEMLGECYLELDQSEDAVRVLEQVLPLADDETRAMTHLRLGKAREALGEWDRAEEDYYLALELNSELTEATELLARLERRREQGAA